MLGACQDPELDSGLAIPRAIEARWPVDVAYRRCEPLDPPVGELRPSSCGPSAPLELLSRVVRSPSSRGDSHSLLRSVAASIAVSQEAANLRRSIEQLRRESPDLDEPATLTALGALQHALAKASGEPVRLLDAFERTHAAWVRDPSSEAVLFNRALIAADLGLCRLARGWWSEYLDLEDAPTWTAEVRQRLGLLPCSPDRQTPETPGELYENALETLLPRWVEAHGSPEADELRSEMNRSGERLATMASDLSIRELADELGAVRTPDHLAAIRAYVRGWKQFRSEDYDAARDSLQQAMFTLRQRGSMLSSWCSIWIAGVDLYSGQFEDAQQRLTALDSPQTASRSPMLAGKVLWASGLAALRAGRLEVAYDRFVRAEQEFLRGQYPQAAGSIRTLKAETLKNLGFLRESWWDRARALRSLQGQHPHFTLHNGLLDGAAVAQMLGAVATSDALLQEAEQVAIDNDDPVSETEALLWKADALRQRRAYRTASKTYRDALEATRLISPDSVREEFESDARIGLWADPQHDPEQNLGELGTLVDFFTDRSASMYLGALQIKASVERRRGLYEAAQKTLDQALGIIQNQRADLGTERLEIGYLESLQAVFDEAIALALATDQPLQALGYLEAARQGGSPADLVADPLPELHMARADEESFASADHPIVVVFGWVDDLLAWWRVDGRGVTSGSRQASALETMVSAFVDRAAAGQLVREDAESLYRILLEEPLRGVAPNRPLIVVPDRYLQRIPYAALRDSTTGVSLIEERAVSLRSSLREALEPGFVEGAARRRADWRILVVGDPAFDQSRLPWLPRLPGAVREAREVAALYEERAMMLIEEAATLRNVRQRIVSSDVLHLAAHTVIGSDPSREVFALAPDPGDNASSLALSEDLLPEATALRLVVLSACSSLGQTPSRSGGLLGFARSFVRRGVPATLGTLWPVSDRLQADLMIGFHRLLLEGLSASEALRRAQLEFLREHPPEACCDWAAVQLLGDLPPVSTHSLDGEGENHVF